MHILIGGYTKHESAGIYQFDFIGSGDQAHLEQRRNVVEVGGPTYFQKDGQFIFTIKNENGQGGIAAFVNGKLVSQLLHEGASPAYIGINKEKKLLYTANYHTGVLAVISYDDQGQLTLLDQVKHENKALGPRPEQAGAHPHYFDETPGGHLVSCDLGQDRVDFYGFDGQKLTHLASYQNEDGFGSRHLAFSPDGKYFYVAGELSSQVNAVKFDEENWMFRSLATYSTIPESWDQHNGAAAIRLSSDGKFLYVSNRGHDSIAVFAVLPDQALKLVQRVSTFGEFPRDFNWDAEEKYVVAANQNSNNATLYQRQSDGTLTPLEKDIAIPEGTRVLFTD
ncbi:lactonase family protein [Lactobacillus delbrueckii subsp. lactis]|uniref:Lactonase family protein n=1 Tax=Lactobacillus delbrueckii subsp. lactis TaxID=29397 RepID=A0A1L3JX39_LACDL|nr:lactonase family protein [Lactobacillus delbrueckii]APG69677.1 3-carboxymuconate cyclase [Lactobacillus delbrueckii subsp. lactis]ASW11667.1 3-carboxymuconate cyclase [Lactobacillus delbrueckii subsp. lactis DSM 20072]ASW63516.1 3-carboxymuconate cyclase [Lactobacillus delbrueckii subsp. lactis]AZA16531.1 MAG: lactonase family protein [Lactobacillus delbrueckii subsp. lactis]AZA24890.1 MAG: lactonase family protein [Lactobacillus delbrueckii subsp. lactis]